MGDVRFLSRDEILELHAEQLDLYGGAEGILKPERLESAIGAPMATFGGQYLNPDLASMAATYLFSLAKNHAFCDGNKRFAVAAAIAFLGMNDQPLKMDPDELADLTLAVAAGSLDKGRLTEAIAAHLPAT